MKAVILAAGQGTRLLPLTEDVQKVMLPVAGKPMLQVTLDSLKQAGVRDVLVVINHLKEQVMDYFGDGSRFGMRIEYKEQPKTLGTADAIRMAADFVANEPFLVTYADEVTAPEAFISFLRDKRQKIGGRKVEDPSLYGVLEVKGGKLAGIDEKPKKPKGNLINAGLYIFEPEVFKYIARTKKSKRGEYEITDTIILMIKDGKDFAVEELRGYRRDIGAPWQLLEVNEAFMKRIDSRNEGTVEEGVTIKGALYLGKNSVVKSGTYITGPVFIGDNCEVGPMANLRPGAVILDNCRIGRAEIKNSIIMQGTKAEHVCYIGDSVIGKGCNIAAHTVLANLRADGANVKMAVNGKLLDTGRRKLGSVIGSGSKLGVNASVMPGVKIGKNCFIGPGVIVYKDLEDNSSVVVKQTYIKTKNSK
jgi:bifunctional UDP-N-acetylglucosamine pyrophosphorylase/glucosamine-1-phosphate N-acetyltransferase